MSRTEIDRWAQDPWIGLAASGLAVTTNRSENSRLTGSKLPPQVISVNVWSGVGAMTDVSDGGTSFTSTTR